METIICEQCGKEIEKEPHYLEDVSVCDICFNHYMEKYLDLGE